ncbi:hypothetical protein RHMOL_Rhmol08G0193400 [Rhododendron molle]|uniref:Uncharacterized protein n=1 Tax=Rhododendron molle TaxID=49168 RepID=A0ACC0MQA1_RHOML|nr:hypothetical protein RHMOL_Rhmol08G0193400 [Rhododendron molle]
MDIPSQRHPLLEIQRAVIMEPHERQIDALFQQLQLIRHAPKTSDDKIEKMVKEFKERDQKCKSFSWRRRFRDEKNIDSINDRHEHFNKTKMLSTYSKGFNFTLLLLLSRARYNYPPPEPMEDVDA